MEELKFSKLFKSVGLKKTKFLCNTDGEIIGVIIKNKSGVAHIDEYGKVIWDSDKKEGMTLEQFRKQLPDRREEDNLSICKKCGGPLNEIYITKMGPICADCYFEMMGNEIEKHPIGMPRKARGT